MAHAHYDENKTLTTKTVVATIYIGTGRIETKLKTTKQKPPTFKPHTNFPTSMFVFRLFSYSLVYDFPSNMDYTIVEYVREWVWNKETQLPTPTAHTQTFSFLHSKVFAQFDFSQDHTYKPYSYTTLGQIAKKHECCDVAYVYRSD